MTFPLGPRPDLSPDAYHADRITPRPSLSNTIMSRLLRSPRHAWHAHPRLNPDFEPEERTTFDVGRAAHAVVTGKGEPPTPVDAPSWQTKAAREERDAIRAAGGTPLLMEQFEAVMAMSEAVFRILKDHKLGSIFMDQARNEIPHYAEIDGALCRAMPDHIGKDGWLYDLKTTVDADPDAIRRSVAGYGYARQAEHYCAVVRAATGEPVEGMRFVFVEKAPPHEGAIVQLKPDDEEVDQGVWEYGWLATARAECAEARRLWAACLEADDWPGYRRAILELGAPRWHAAAAEDRAAARPDAGALRRVGEMMKP